jgi:hypothetical protein
MGPTRHGEAGAANDLGEGLSMPISKDRLRDRLAEFRCRFPNWRKGGQIGDPKIPRQVRAKDVKKYYSKFDVAVVVERT